MARYLVVDGLAGHLVDLHVALAEQLVRQAREPLHLLPVLRGPLRLSPAAVRRGRPLLLPAGGRRVARLVPAWRP